MTLAVNASSQGPSGGEPRDIEDPAARMEDIRCAIDYLVTLPYVDAERIGAFYYRGWRNINPYNLRILMAGV